MTGAAEEHIQAIEAQGYTILEGVIEPELVAALNEALDRLERELGTRPGANLFEGHHTIRIYNLLARDAVFQKVPVHPAVLPIVEGVLDRGCLVSSLSSISIDPGETAQPIHADDTVIGLPRPQSAAVCNSMWALTDFTEANGATRVVPGSPPLRRQAGVRHAIRLAFPRRCARGSVLVWNGSAVARRRRQPHRTQTGRDRHELLRRLHPPAGEPAARHTRSTWSRTFEPRLQELMRLRHLPPSGRPHRQAEPGSEALGPGRRVSLRVGSDRALTDTTPVSGEPSPAAPDNGGAGRGRCS